MSETISGRPGPAVSFTDLGRELGISAKLRHDMVTAGLVRPVHETKRGRPTRITPEDAERVRAAVRLAVLVGGVIVALRLLAKSGASISGGSVTIPLP